MIRYFSMFCFLMPAFAAIYTCNTKSSNINPLQKKELTKQYKALLEQYKFENNALLYTKKIREESTTKKLLTDFSEICVLAKADVGGDGVDKTKLQTATLLLDKQRDQVGGYYIASFGFGFDEPDLLQLKNGRKLK